VLALIKAADWPCLVDSGRDLFVFIFFWPKEGCCGPNMERIVGVSSTVVGTKYIQNKKNQHPIEVVVYTMANSMNFINLFIFFLNL